MLCTGMHEQRGAIDSDCAVLTRSQYRGVPGSAVLYAGGTEDVRNEVGVRVYVRWPCPSWLAGLW